MVSVHMTIEMNKVMMCIDYRLQVYRLKVARDYC